MMTNFPATNAIRTVSHPTLAAVAVLLACLCTACGGGLKGTYTPAGQTFGGVLISSVTFTSGEKVEVTAMGVTHEGTYVLDGKRVKITISGDTTIMSIDDQGCLDAGGMIGKLCKK
jgi:hypothetical protein